MDPWVIEMCRKVCLHRFVVWTCVVAAIVGAGLLNRRYLANFFGGPYPASESYLETLPNPDAAQHYFVRVSGSKVVDTGLHEVEVTNEDGSGESKTETARYYALETGGRLLLVKSSSKPPAVVEGTISSVPPDLWQHMFRTPRDRQQLEPYFLPELLDASDFRLPGYFGLVVAGAALSLAVFFGLRQWRMLRSPLEMPVVKRVQNWGGVQEASARVEREFKQGVRLRQRNFRMTDNYAVFSSWINFQVYRLDDLLWAYKRVIRHSVDFIPTGKTYNARMIFCGGSLDVQGTAGKVELILACAEQRAPWAFFGYSIEADKLFREDKAGLRRVVEERRRQGGAPPLIGARGANLDS